MKPFFGTLLTLFVPFSLNAAFALPLEQEFNTLRTSEDKGHIQPYVPAQFENAHSDNAEIIEVMKKAAALSPDADPIIGPIPGVYDLEIGSDYVHAQYDTVETSSSVLFDYWNAYRSGPSYFKVNNETCKVGKMTYRHSYPWSRKQDNNRLVFRCFEANGGVAKKSRAFVIIYGLNNEDIIEVQGNIDGEIGTRVTVTKKGKSVY